MTKTPKTIEARFRKLTDIEHVLLRPGRYIGAVKNHEAEAWTPNGEKMTKGLVAWNPGLIKLFDEIISNSVDHSKRPEGKHLDSIRVEIDEKTGVISVADNGGIPVQLHTEYKEYVPEMVFGSLRAGENFDDDEDSTLTGQNGEGAALTNIFSKEFTVETSDGKKRLRVKWTDNMHNKSEPKITTSDGKGFTKITFLPDYDKLETKLDAGNIAMLTKRVYDIAGCNPQLKIYLNGSRIQIKSFKDYIELYTNDFEFDDESDGWSVGVAHASQGFEHISFVNTTETKIGGTHIEYVVNQITAGIREFIERRHKVEIKPAEIKQHLQVFINATIVRPRYSSQTKDELITEVKTYGTSYKASEAFIRKLTKSKVIQSVLDWAQAKAMVNEKRALAEMDKKVDKADPKKLLKLQDAIWAGVHPQKCILFICEGQSAAKVGKGTGNKETMGFFELKGVPLNARDADTRQIIDNTEIQELMIAMGLKVGTEVKSPNQLRYGQICIMTDADQDGAHIAGLHMANWDHFWPELFKLGMVFRFITPVMKAKTAKETISFFSTDEYDAWVKKNPNVKHTNRYYKGLGSSKDSDFKEYWQNIDKHLIKLTYVDDSDKEMLELVFGKEVGSADERKEWLGIEDKS